MAIPASLVCSASLNSFVSALDSYAVFISAAVWSAVAPASIPDSLLTAASSKTFVSEFDSYAVLISEAD